MRLAVGLWALLAGVLGAAGSAEAGPVFFAVLSAGGGFSAAFGATAVGAFATTTVGRLLISVAVSALTRARQPEVRDPGLQTRSTQLGGVNPVSSILGLYATSGAAACPPMSHGSNNRFLTFVIDVADTPVDGLQGLFVDGERVELGTTPDTDGFLPFLGRLVDVGRIKFVSGNQTAADPWLLTNYGSYPERPWASTMIGRGVAYAIVSFTYDRERYQGLPSVRFEVRGMRLYDPRLDSTAGGAGPQRFNAPATWAFSSNPAVMIYNILRGITLLDGSMWGGGAAAADLPASVWFAAMNECDVPITLAEGGTEPQFRAGFEFTFDDEPAAVIEELLKTCNGSLFEAGGIWKLRVGPPALPVYFFNDPLVSRPQDLEPFPGLDQTFNAVHASYPEPEQLWEAKDAPPVYDAALEEADGGRRLVAELSLPAAPYGLQVQRLMRALQQDHRRMIRHTISLPPEAAVLEPMDTVAWTSLANGYAGKLFEVGEVTDETLTMVQTVSLREVDPADYEWSTDFELPLGVTSPNVVAPPVLAVPGFAVAAYTLTDGAGVPRRPGLRLSWDGPALAEADGVAYEVRTASTSTVAAQGTVQRPVSGEVIVGGLLPSTTYQVRARAIGDSATVWTGWLSVTTDNVKLTREDLATETIVRFLGPASWVTLPGSGIVITSASGFTNLIGSTIVDASLAAGAQQVYAAIRATLSAPADRWVRLRIRLSAFGTTYDTIQYLLMRVGSGEYAVAAPAETPLNIGSIQLSIAPESLGAGDTVTVTDARARVISIY